MNGHLAQVARDVALDAPEQAPLRLAFGLACAERVEHLLEDPRAVECLRTLRDHVAGRCDVAALERARQTAAQVANGHRGSPSIDGAAHAAVSATYAVANAVAGRALDAASYAAYATVYAYGGYAVNDPSAFQGEYGWQAAMLAQLSETVRPAG